MEKADGLAALLLAAGEGKRLRSSTPKVLQRLGGRPLLHYPVELARQLGAERIAVVVGSGESAVREQFAASGVEFVRQAERLGTAHAAQQAEPLLRDHLGPILILYGDCPLYRSETLGALLERFRESRADLALLTTVAPDPSGYGRIVRDASGRIARIVEHSSASPAERELREINPALYVIRGPQLFADLAQIRPDPARGEYFLTDLVEIALAQGRRVETVTAADFEECQGINTRLDLARAERTLRRRINEGWLLAGVQMDDPEHTYIDASVQLAPDVHLAPGVVLRGQTRVAAGARIDAHAVVEDSSLGEGTWIKPHCWIESSQVGARCAIGPSAHLRPGCALADGVRIGNFVEVKNSQLGAGAKADHLAYVGDADVGAGATLGCGAVTVNYDGERKHRTRIGEGAFVGCNANLIAPVAIEAGAYVAAGSTITDRVPPGALGVARARQRNIEGWRARRFGAASEGRFGVKSDGHADGTRAGAADHERNREN
jgi:bifunctional UDP-N-acetylglucosamine pyrophosphorylase/glucosamine-1-phosphate N-acetyltransferase